MDTNETQANKEAAYNEYLNKYPILKEIDSLAAKKEGLLKEKNKGTPKIVKIFSIVVLIFVGLFYGIGSILATMSQKSGESFFVAFIRAGYEAGAAILVADVFVLLLFLLVIFLHISARIKSVKIEKQIKAIDQTFEEIKKIPPFEG